MASASTFPFFLVGNDRSGTTLLRLVLDRGSVAIPPESMFLADFAPVRQRGGLEDPAQAERLMRAVWSHPRVRLWKLPAEPPAVPSGLSHENAYRFIVSAPFQAYARKEEKERWADKTPLYLRYVEEIDAIWPDARFVIVARDGRDVALSVMRVPFGANNVWAAARAWAQGIRLGLEAERSHPDRVVTVRYEDLVARPAEEAARVSEFLGLEFREEMLEIERTDADKILKEQAGWFTNVWAGINTSAVGKWKREMTPAQQRLFARVAGPELEAVGYEAGEPASVAGLRTAAYAGHDAAMRGVNFVRLRLLQERGREVRYVLKRKLAGAWR
jgi:sulfotransferase family protein